MKKSARSNRNGAISALLLALPALMVAPLTANAANIDQPLPRIFSTTGNVDYALIGGTLSNNDNNNCRNRLNSSTAALSIPRDANIQAAYLNWSGSNRNSDTTVTLNGAQVIAEDVQTQTFHRNEVHFSNTANVTNLVTGSGAYTLAGLNFNKGRLYCDYGTAYGTWALTVVYSSESAAPGTVDVFGNAMQPTRASGHNAVFSIGLTAKSNCHREVDFASTWMEADRNRNDSLWINGDFMGTDIIGSNQVHNIDIENHLIPLAPGENRIEYIVRTFATRDGSAYDRAYNTLSIAKSSTCDI